MPPKAAPSWGTPRPSNGKRQSILIISSDSEDEDIQITTSHYKRTKQRRVVKDDGGGDEDQDVLVDYDHENLLSQIARPDRSTPLDPDNEDSFTFPFHSLSLRLSLPSLPSTPPATLIVSPRFTATINVPLKLSLHSPDSDLFLLAIDFGGSPHLECVQPLLRALTVLSSAKLIQLEAKLVLWDSGQRLDFTTDLTDAFYLSPGSDAKRLLLNAVYGHELSTLNGHANSDGMVAPKRATIGSFYDALKRAPVTSGGLNIANSTRNVNGGPASSRRRNKGKKKAEDQDFVLNGYLGAEDDDGDIQMELVEEDELVFVNGLKSQLMPFQVRSLRWLLAREGFYISPSASMVDTNGKDGHREGNGLAGVGRARLSSVDSLYEPAPPEDGVPIDLDEAMDQGEGKESRLLPLPEDQAAAVRRGPLWLQLQDGNWWNLLEGQLVRKDPGAQQVPSGERGKEAEDCDAVTKEDDEGQGGGHAENRIGAMLCEEMGLGKTVEMIALILMHREPERALLQPYYSTSLKTTVQPSAMTLVISPIAIVAQWEQELKHHASGLRVMRYEGVKVLKKMTTKQIAESFDVVLTTFDVLRKEVVLARKPHERSLRSGEGGRGRYTRSMLVSFEWLRIVMDEAQMLGTEASAASETASLVPRKYSFCVTGTPIKERIEDLQGLLKFIKLEPAGSNKKSFERFLSDPAVFNKAIGSLGARTTKAQVVHELELPVQHRMIVPVGFSAVEKYYYETRYLEALTTLELESDGTPKNMDKFDGLDHSELSRALVSLRQLCAHPQLGQTNKRVLGNVLKTVDEVLGTMADGATGALQSETRIRIATLVRGAQLQCWDREDCERFEEALKVFQTAVADLEPIVEEIAASLRTVWAERNAERARRGRSEPLSETDDDTLGGALGLGLDDEDPKTDEVPQSDAERAIATRLSALRSRLRETLVVQHSAHFFEGAAYFNLGKYPTEEASAYQKAEVIRQALLRPYEVRVTLAATRLKDQLRARQRDEPLTVKHLEFPFSKIGGAILAKQVFEDIACSIDALNGQAELLWQWREYICKMLDTKVSISGDDATGDEYAERAELQEKLDCYIEAYQGLLGDWRYGLTGERSALDAALTADALGGDKDLQAWSAAAGTKRRHEIKSKVSKKKRIDMRGRVAPSLDRGDKPADILRFELLLERAEVQGERQFPGRPADDAQAKKKRKRNRDDADSDEEDDSDPHIIPVRHLISAGLSPSSSKQTPQQADTLYAHYRSSKKALDTTFAAPEEELLLLSTESQRLRAILKPKEKMVDRLRAELGDITRAFNIRLTYFAQLQLISDEVADPDFESKKWKGLAQEMQICRDDAEKLEASIIKKRSQSRYLESLQNEQNKDDDANVCVICRDTHLVFILSVCGHLVCQTCFNLWHSRSHACSICKRPLARGEWETVKYHRKPDKQVVALGIGDRDEDATDDITMEDIETPTKLRLISARDLEAIRDVDTVAPLSSKSDLVVKQIKHIRRNDPTAKVVVFSAWVEALEILMQACMRNGIQFVRLEGGGKKEAVVGRFIDDPDVAAFFLHTRSAATGLNLTCAQYTILLEPLLHPTLELQAIGRTHRIGQTKETTVLQFAVQNTVDDRVAELRGRQKTSLFLDNSAVDTAEESKAMESDFAHSSVSTRGNARGIDDVVDDEDDLSRVFFLPEHYRNLQKAYFPREGAFAPTPSPTSAPTPVPPESTPAAMAGIAAASRIANTNGASRTPSS